MTLPAWAIAAIRTGVQSLIAWVFSAAVVINLLGWLEANLGLTLTPAQVEVVGFGVAITAVTALVNWLGKHPSFQWLNKLISLFLANSPALYDKPGDRPPDTAVDMAGEEGQFGDDGQINLGTVLTLALIVLVVVLILRLT